MKPLDESARETLLAGKRAERASLEDRERVRRKLEVALSAGVVGPTIPAPSTGAAKAWAWKTLFGTVMAVVAVVGAGVSFWRPEKVEVTAVPVVVKEAPAVEVAPAQQPPPVVVAPDVVSPVVVSPVEALPRPVVRPSKARPVVVDQPGVTVGPVSAPAPVPGVVVREEDELEAETQGLREVQAALREKDAARALRLVAEQERRFPHGQLGPEREAVRVLATCASDPAEGSRAFASFMVAHPTSPLLPRLRAACAH